MLKTSQIGLIIIAITISLGAILYSFTVQAIQVSTGLCVAELGATCPHEGYVPPETFLGVLFLLGLGSLGTYLAMQRGAGIIMKPNVNLRSLDNEERNVYKAVIASNGAIFQSELMEKLEFSKVKITRLLDRLEAKNILERRR